MQPHEIIIGVIAAAMTGAGLGLAIIRAITWLAHRFPIKEKPHHDRNSNHYD